MIFINIDYSYLSYCQSRARIQTKDRIKEANLYFIFSDKGIERLIYRKVKNKDNFTTSYYDYEKREIGNQVGIGSTVKVNKEVHQGRLFCFEDNPKQ